MRVRVEWDNESSEIECEIDGFVEIFKIQLESLTGIPVAEQEVEGMSLEATDSTILADALRTASQTVRVRRRAADAPRVCADANGRSGERRATRISAAAFRLSLNAVRHRLRQQALSNAARSAAGSSRRRVPHGELQSQEQLQMQRRIDGAIQQFRQYEDPALHVSARAVMPADLVEKGSAFRAGSLSSDDLTRDLLRWFKEDFFQWVNEPPCWSCEGATKAIGMALPTPHEQQGLASRVEVYQCTKCSCIVRFPRYNDARVLLETRRGRCGEWAQVFTLCCRALGIDARFVNDWTDHVWTEVFSTEKNAWVHTDCCENIYDCPFTYEAGWGKKLTYIIATNTEECVDVTRRYTKDYQAVLARRTLVSEEWIAALVRARNDGLRGGIASAQRRAEVDERQELERQQLDEHTRARSREAQLKEEERRGRISGNE